MFAVFCCHCSKRAQSERLSVLCCVCSKFSQPGKPAPRLASSHAKYPDIYRRSKPAVAKLRREAAAFGVNGRRNTKQIFPRLGSARQRGAVSSFWCVRALSHLSEQAQLREVNKH
ncbi:hypothetical protein ElyMa_006210800 [Elysia marginata]|uniref:Secreted protein n=1 Tax=Elysia marginata TaxID=1093978 RepID=A0AAV4H518_9GAST|nr:hypothetical protein ElyMa_006210800 [Elysia marginata]